MKTSLFRVLFALSLALALPALADEPVKVFPAGSTEEMLNSTKKPGDLDNQGPGSGAIKINTQCTDRQGKIFSKGEAGYEDCLRNRMEDQKQMAPRKKSGFFQKKGTAELVKQAVPVLEPLVSN